MNKIRIKSTPLFKQVAAVIGEEGAQVELAEVAHSTSVEFNKSLYKSFYWTNSPQGGVFWQDVNKGVNPCSN